MVFFFLRSIGKEFLTVGRRSDDGYFVTTRAFGHVLLLPMEPKM
jgi:hypothetical protein